MANAKSDMSIASTVLFTGKDKLREGKVSWIVADILDKMNLEHGNSIRSNIITIMDTKWLIKIYPNGKQDTGGKGKIVVGIWLENNRDVTVDFEIKVGKSELGWFKTVTENNRKCNIRTGAAVLELSHKEVFENKERLITFSKMEFLIKITLIGEGSTCAEVNLQQETVLNSFEIEGLSELSQNFASLLWDESSSDFLIVCGEESFPVHRMVLEARSCYFQGLLKSSFVESEIGKVEIKDMASETVKAVIEYIYTGKFKALESRAAELLVAADRFHLNLLKNYCAEWLISNLNQDNAVDLFVLADKYNAVNLRLKAKQMIVENSAEILKQDGLQDKLGTLAFELLKAVSSFK